MQHFTDIERERARRAELVSTLIRRSGIDHPTVGDTARGS